MCMYVFKYALVFVNMCIYVCVFVKTVCVYACLTIFTNNKVKILINMQNEFLLTSLQYMYIH